VIDQQNKIPAVVHQVWPGEDMIPERLASYMAQNVAYCNEAKYIHRFWKLKDDHTLLLKTGISYTVHDVFEIINDLRVLEMLTDQNLHLVMKSDILRFSILYEFGGFYADLDLAIVQNLDKYRHMDYVCGWEKPRPVVCTAFIGAVPRSPVNKAVIEFILTAHQKMKRENIYPKNLWDVLVFTGPDMLTDILKQFPEIVPFQPEVFFPLPIPQIQRPFTVHHFAGAKAGGWAGEQCKGIECKDCKDKPNCNIVRVDK
jgi:mannosyltransferase OCH1-like enzyme